MTEIKIEIGDNLREVIDNIIITTPLGSYPSEMVKEAFNMDLTKIAEVSIEKGDDKNVKTTKASHHK